MLLVPCGLCGAQQLLVVHADGFFPPNEMLGGEQVHGVHIDLVQAAAARLGISVAFRRYPWKRAIVMLQRGEADAITYMGKTAEREQFGIFVEGNILSYTKNGFFTQKENAGKFNFSGDLQTLRDYTIGTIRGRAYYPEFDQTSFLQRDDGAADEEALLRKLTSNRVDLALGHVARIKYIAQSLNLADRIVFLEPYAPPFANYLVFSKAKHHEALARRFAGAMESVKKSAAFQEMLKKYQVKAEDF
jgi:polar amino acid transport system substrate-binding protein